MFRTLLLLVFLTLFLSVSGQPRRPERFSPPERPGQPSSPARSILLVPKKSPEIYRFAEKQNRMLWRPGQAGSGTIAVTRIRGDSVYLAGAGYRFAELDSIVAKYPSGGGFFALRYCRSSAATWDVYFPPDSVYRSRSAWSGYLHAMQLKVKKERFVALAPPFTHNLVKFNFSRVLNMEIAYAYEYRFTHEWAVEVEGAVQFRAADPLSYNMIQDIYPVYKYSGFSVYPGLKYYFNTRGYVQSVFLYRYMTLDSASSTIPGGQERLLDEFRNDFGMSLRIGKLSRFGGLVIDGYFGIGFKLINFRQWVYGYYYHNGTSDRYYRWYNDDHSPNLKIYNEWMPVVNCGIKIGVGF